MTKMFVNILVINSCYGRIQNNGEAYWHHKSHAYLQGGDARIFRKQMEHIDTLKTSEIKQAYINR